MFGMAARSHGAIAQLDAAIARIDPRIRNERASV